MSYDCTPGARCNGECICDKLRKAYDRGYNDGVEWQSKQAEESYSFEDLNDD